MTTLTSLDISSNVIPLRACRTIRESVAEYCAQLGLSEVQTEACQEVARNLHSAAEGRKTADRIHDKMRAVRTRLGTRPDDDSPRAA